MDVTIVQSYGRMKYLIEGDEIILSPGDALHIPAGVYHEEFTLNQELLVVFVGHNDYRQRTKRSL